MSRPPHAAPPAPDLSERGAPIDGEPQRLNRRLFFQLQVFDVAPTDSPTSALSTLSAHLEQRQVESVLYADLHSPRGFGLLTWSEDPEHFVRAVRPLVDHGPLHSVVPRVGWSMLGRTYSSGHERDLAHWLLERPRDTVLHDDWGWAIWYPLRRKGAFNRLDGKEQGGILREHGTIGRGYGTADLAHDVRLACAGLDQNDNDFVIGLVGKELYPLSHVVQRMRKTEQTAEWMEHMGPFFVGRKVWQHRNG
jgi:chlorite dismutase